VGADWTRAEFDAAVDELRASDVPDLDLAPAKWRSILRDGSEVDAFKAGIEPFSSRFIPQRSEWGPRNQEDRARQLHDLGTAVLAQWDRTGDRRALRLALAVWRRVVALSWLTDIALAINALAARFLARYHATAALPLLDAAVYLGRDAVFDPLAFLPSRPGRLLVLAEALRCRYEHTGDRAALVEAVTRYREAAGVPDTRQRALDGLAVALAHVYELTGDETMLADDAVAAEVAAPSRVPAGLSTGGSVLPGSASCGPDPDRAPADAPRDRPLVRARILTEVSAARLVYYLRTGATPRLTDAIELLREALELTPVDHRDRPLRLARLGGALYHAYRRRLNVSTLEDSVAAYRAALTLPFDRLDLRTEALAGLALALRARHNAEDGRPEHLAEAKLLAGELSAQYPPGHPGRTNVLADLGDLLGSRSARPSPKATRARPSGWLSWPPHWPHRTGKRRIPRRPGYPALRCRCAAWPPSSGAGWPPNGVTSAQPSKHTGSPSTFFPSWCPRWNDGTTRSTSYCRSRAWHRTRRPARCAAAPTRPRRWTCSNAAGACCSPAPSARTRCGSTRWCARRSRPTARSLWST
jgi:hypothetical protein